MQRSMCNTVMRST